MTEKYSDIINLPHPNPQNHIRMSISARAAQFAPFAALTGHSDAITETARITDKKLELDESIKEAINQKLMTLKTNLKKCSIVTITFFCPDKKKAGGRYISSTGYIKKFLFLDQKILMSNSDKIITNDIVKIQYEREK